MSNRINQEKLAEKLKHNEILEVGEQKRAQTVGLTEAMRSQVVDMVYHLKNEIRLDLNKEALQNWKEAYAEGLAKGLELGREIYD